MNGKINVIEKNILDFSVDSFEPVLYIFNKFLMILN
jgi:hypothetical protein